MEISHTFAQRNLAPVELQNNLGKKKMDSFAYRQHNPKNSLMIDINLPTQRILAPLHPRTAKGHTKEIYNNLNMNHRHQTKVDKYPLGNNPGRNIIQFGIEEEDVIPHFEQVPHNRAKFIRANDFHLPKIIKDGPKSFPIYKRPRNANRSLDYGHDNTLLLDDLAFQQRVSQRDRKASVENKEQRINEDMESIKPAKLKKRNKENTKVKQREPTQETHRTLTSIYNSERSINDPFGDHLLQTNSDSKEVIKNVVEKHVDQAYKKIGVMKRNFHRRNQSYWFHNQSNL